MKKSKKNDEKRIERLYYQHCSGIQINIMDIGKVFRAGQQAIDAGLDDDGVSRTIVDFVETIRKN